MNDNGVDLNAREWAVLFWFIVILAIGLMKPEVRSAARDVLRRAFVPKVAAVLLLYLAWIAALVILAQRFGLWRTELVKGTVVWSVTTGLALTVSSTEAATPGYFRRQIAQTIGLFAFME